MAHLRVERAADGYRDRFRTYAVVLDGRAVGRIKRGQAIEIAVSPGAHVAMLRIDWCASPHLTFSVSPGEVAVLACRSGGSLLSAPWHTLFARGRYVTIDRIEKGAMFPFGAAGSVVGVREQVCQRVVNLSGALVRVHCAEVRSLIPNAVLDQRPLNLRQPPLMLGERTFSICAPHANHTSGRRGRSSVTTRATMPSGSCQGLRHRHSAAGCAVGPAHQVRKTLAVESSGRYPRLDTVAHGWSRRGISMNRRESSSKGASPEGMGRERSRLDTQPSGGEMREPWNVFSHNSSRLDLAVVRRSRSAVTSGGSGVADLRSPRRHATVTGSVASLIGTFCPSSSWIRMFVS